MGRLFVGLGFCVVGLVLGLLGGMLPGFDFGPMATGLIAIGLVTSGVALVEKKLDARKLHKH